MRTILRAAILVTTMLLSSVAANAFDGAMLKLSANQSIASGVNQPIAWAGSDYDTMGFWSASQPTRLTVPAGVNWVRLVASQIYSGSSCAGFRQLIILKNKTPTNYGWFRGDPVVNQPATCGTTSDAQGMTPVIPVVPGDYFELTAYQSSGAPLDLLLSTGTWFTIEVIQ